MNVNALTTRDEVDAAIETLTQAWLLLGGDQPELATTKTELLTLQRQLKTGDYIVLEPDLSGWHYITHYYEPVTERDRSTGHEGWQSVAALALRIEQPVVLAENLCSPRREHVARRLRQAGVVVINGDD